MPAPIACTLNADERSERLEEMADLGRDALVSVERLPRGAELRFTAGSRPRVEAIAAAESRCCAFLDLTVSASAALTVLTIGAPDGAEAAVDDLVDAFQGGASR